MAWKETLLDASFRGARFDVLRTRDHGERAIVEHDYPYRPGAEVEDMGRKARRISITAVFYGPQYENALEQLIKALEEPGKGELVHPVFGAITVQVASWDIPHEAEQPDHAEVTLEFVEALPDNTFLGATGQRGATQNAALAAQNSAENVRQSAGKAFARWVETTARQFSLANKVEALNELHDALDAYDATRSAGRAAVNYLDFPSAYLADLEAAQGAKAAPFGSGSTGGFRNWQRISGVFTSRNPSGGSGRTYPTAPSAYAGTVTTGPASGLPEPSPTVSLPTPTSARTSTTADLTTPQGATRAHVAVLANVGQTATMSDHATDLLGAEVDTPTLTPQEVEAVVGNVRDRLQDCMDMARQVLPAQDAYPLVQALRDAALALQQLGEAIINARPPLVLHTVATPCNMHLLAHRLYGDYRRAGEIERLNPAIRNPNFLGAGQQVVVYAR